MIPAGSAAPSLRHHCPGHQKRLTRPASSKRLLDPQLQRINIPSNVFTNQPASGIGAIAAAGTIGFGAAGKSCTEGGADAQPWNASNISADFFQFFMVCFRDAAVVDQLLFPFAFVVLHPSEDGCVLGGYAIGGFLVPFGLDILTAQKKVRAGDIIYNPMRANIGSLGVVDDTPAGGLVSPDYHVLRTNGMDAEYLTALLRTPFYKFYIDIITTGSIRDRLYPQDLQGMLVPKVDATKRKQIKDLQTEIAKEIDSSQKRVSGLSVDLNETVREMLLKKRRTALSKSRISGS